MNKLKWSKPHKNSNIQQIKSECGQFLIVKRDDFYEVKRSTGSIWRSVGVCSNLDDAKDICRRCNDFI